MHWKKLNMVKRHTCLPAIVWSLTMIDLTGIPALARCDSYKKQRKMVAVRTGNKRNVDVFYAVLLLKVLFFSCISGQGIIRFLEDILF